MMGPSLSFLEKDSLLCLPAYFLLEFNSMWAGRGGVWSVHCPHCIHQCSMNIGTNRKQRNPSLSRASQDPPNTSNFTSSAYMLLYSLRIHVGVPPLTLISHKVGDIWSLSPHWVSEAIAEHPPLKCHQIGECDAPHTLCSGSQDGGGGRTGSGKGWGWTLLGGDSVLWPPLLSHCAHTSSMAL